MRRTLKDRPGAPMHPVSIVWTLGLIQDSAGQLPTVPELCPLINDSIQCTSGTPVRLLRAAACRPSAPPQQTL